MEEDDVRLTEHRVATAAGATDAEAEAADASLLTVSSSPRSQSLLETDDTAAKLLLEAAANNQVACLQELLQSGVDANLCYKNQNPMCIAAYEGYSDVIRTLLEHGCRGDKTDQCDPMWNRQPIHHASARGHLDIVKLMVEHGIYVNVLDREGRTPLHWAATFGWVPIAEFLVSKGAAINIVQKDGFTALHAATCLGHQPMCQFLIEQGAEMNRADRDGWSPLHAAVCYGHLEIAKLLLASGSKVNQQTNDGETALHISVERGGKELLNLLFEANANLEDTTIHGFTPFFDAVWRTKYLVGRSLVDKGASVSVANKAGYTALYVATVRLDHAFVKLILAAGCNFCNESWIHKDIFTSLLEHHKLVSHYRSLAGNVALLQTLCIHAVRRTLGRGVWMKVGELPVPPSLKSLLRLEYLDEDLTS